LKTTLNVAVLGVGSLGKEHARIYAEMAAANEIQFAGLHDTSATQAAKIAEKYRVPVFASVDEAIAKSDALSIVTPTHTHFDLARRILAAGKHALVE
jgi:predicted dehydrogenase